MKAQWNIIGLALLGALALGLSGRAPADDNGRLVTFDVAVTDRNDNPVTGLQRGNFKVFEDNVEQTITYFGFQRKPAAVVVLLEFTESFGYKEDVVAPAAGLLRTLQSDDWAAFVSFDVVPTIVTDFTRHKNSVVHDLRRLRMPLHRDVALFDSVYFVLERMKGIEEKGAIFLVASGIDTMSGKRSLVDMLKKAETSDTMIYTVDLTPPNFFLESHPDPDVPFQLEEAEFTLALLAENSGGIAFAPLFSTQYPRIWEVVNADLRNQYTLGFVSPSTRSGNKLRKLKVAVAGTDVDGNGKPDKLKVRHKRGYPGSGL